jgi:predicted MFS family arabinose efflux permease
MQQRRPWSMISAMAAAQVVSWGTLYYAFSLMVTPMRRSLGWSPNLLNGALSLGLLVMGAASVPVGLWIDRGGGRRAMSLGSLLGALSLAAWSLVRAPWAFYLVWVGIGLSLAGVLYESAFAVIALAFETKAQRWIILLTLAGGFASTVCLPLTQMLIASLGWRGALVVLAGANLAICLPLHACFVPGSSRLARSRARSPGPVYAGMVRQRAFWGLALWFTAHNFIASALVFQLVPLLTEWRVAMPTIIGCMMLFGPMQVAGRLAWMLLGARMSVRSMGWVVAAALSATLVGMLVLPHAALWLGAGVALFGLGNGILTIVRGIAVPELMGSENYGAINGVLAFPVMAARALAPVAAASIWSRAGNPTWMVGALLACAIVGGLGFVLAISGRSGRGAAG